MKKIILGLILTLPMVTFLSFLAVFNGDYNFYKLLSTAIAVVISESIVVGIYYIVDFLMEHVFG